MNSRLFFLLVFASITTAISAQTTITGEVLDSLTKKGEPYATIRVYKNKNSEKPIAMWVTDTDGRFSQTVTAQGNFFISFNSMGRREIVRRISLGADKDKVDLGTLLFQDDTKQMEGVTVVAQKPLVKMETDKMTYDVQNDVDSKTNTVLDMLRKVPMVTVDGQDNITVNGQSSFKVYVDGKPNIMFSANPSQIFKSMPASSVKSIEVVTNPGARFDAEGTGGVLNIMMNHVNGQKTFTNGYNGNINATVGNKGSRGAAFVSGQQGKFTYSVNLMYGRGKSKDTEIFMKRTAPDGSTMDYYQTASGRESFTMGNVSLGFEIDSMSNLGASFGVTRYGLRHNGYPTTKYIGGIYGAGFQYSNFTSTETDNNSYNGSIDYQRFFNADRTSSLVLSYLFTTMPNSEKSERYYSNLPPGIPFPVSDLYSEANTRGTEHTAQADFTTPIGKGQVLNTGAKYILRLNTSDSKYYNVLAGVQTYDPTKSVNYKNNQNILAGYAEYTATIGKFGTKAGLRYEHTWEDVKFILGSGSDFKKNYGSLVPSASITYNLAATVNMGINYGMRITRPGISYMNPYVDHSDPTYIKYGNPNVEVEKSHNVSFVFNFFTPKLMINLTLGENFADNQISEYSFMQSGTLNTTYGNIVRSRWTNFHTFVNYAITPKTRLMLNGGFDYGDIRSNQLAAHNHGWQADVFAGIQQTLPWDIKLSCFAGGMTKKYTLQGYSGGYDFISATIDKSFFKDKFSIGLQFMTPFDGKIKIDQYSRGADFEQSVDIIIPMRYIGLSFTWNFGNTKKQFQTHESKISNDFQEHKSTNQQMGGVGTGTGIGM
ncbi:hypothetical protein HMPREF9140_01827 [Prevotella micans F0438]|uniref:Outer membrane protein beta-barrel domain-containing protein n=2 Tax=Prevotella micans TaxID=189723 RepID=H1Q4I9_9BACT|nr:hypothetical protein HMPREF9140_01827 [Prevotella micans F0438]